MSSFIESGMTEDFFYRKWTDGKDSGKVILLSWEPIPLRVSALS